MENKKSSKAVRIILAAELIAADIMLLFALIVAVMLGTYLPAALSAVASVLMIFIVSNETPRTRSSRPRRAVIGFLLLASAIVLLFALPGSFSGKQAWRYEVQRSYVINRGRIGNADHFPEELPESADNFTTDYFPSVFNGAGHYSAAFSADEKTVESYLEYAQKNAVFSCTLEEWLASGNGMRMSGEQLRQMLELSGNSSAALSLWTDDIMEQDAENVVVYVLESNFEWENPYTRAILINQRERRIMFSLLGRPEEQPAAEK